MLFNESGNPTIARIIEYLKADRFMAKTAESEFVEAIYMAYAGKCDILGELKKMTAWLIADPRRQKKNYKRFIVNWLSRVNKPFVYNKE